MRSGRQKREIETSWLFQENLEALLHSGKRYIVNEGGSRSSKTYSIMQVLIYLQRKTPDLSISVVSRSMPHLKKGAMADWEKIMKKDWGWYIEDWHNKTDHKYEMPNGSSIEFFGLEDPDKAKGPGRKILYMNEANLNRLELFEQLDIRTEDTVIMDLNPADFNCWVYDIADGPDAIKIHSTYKDNPFLKAPQIRSIERHREIDPEGLMWKVYGLGLRGSSEEQIYTHHKIVDAMPNKGVKWYGIDFGYNVPTAIIEVEYHDDELYAREVLYETKLTTGELIERMKAIGIDQESQLFCDAAEPKTIQELFNAGFNAYPADKDVTEGIRKVKSVALHITADSTNLLREMSGYKWIKDKNGEIGDEPDKAAGNDHTCDALRYAIFTRLKTPFITGGDFIT